MARRERLLSAMEAPPSRTLPIGEAADDPAAPMARIVARAADDRKAVDIAAIRVSHLTSATSFFVNMVGRSKAQINAIVKNIEDEVDEELGRKAHRQGKALGGWVCLDFDSVVVNVFSQEQRDFYGIEKFWAAGQPLDLSDVVSANAPDEAVVVDADDVDDWQLDDDEDWALDDDEDWALDNDDDNDDDNVFAAFSAEAAVAVEPPEVTVVEEANELSDEALMATGLLSRLDDEDVDDEDGDWALGDEELRALIQKDQDQ